jgi:hypothetical protein
MPAIPAVLPSPCAGTPKQQLQPKEVSNQGATGPCPPWLIARGPSLGVPRLDRVALHHGSFGSDAAAAGFASILIELGIASPHDWRRCSGDPVRFIGRALDRFLGSHGEAEIDGAFELSVTFSTDAHEWRESEDEPDGSRLFLYMEAYSCGFVNLGPALALCEKEHPRLPVTFARRFLNSMGRHYRIYNDRDAEEHISYLEENYDPTEDREALRALPDRNSILPACMKRQPLGGRSLRVLLSRMTPGSRVARLLRAVLELERVSETIKLPEIPEPILDLFCDCNPPVPVLLAIYQQGDAIEASFDDESQSMQEATPEPWPLIPFDGTDPKSTEHAFECLGGVLDTLAAARRVLNLVPGWEPIRRERNVDHD